MVSVLMKTLTGITEEVYTNLLPAITAAITNQRNSVAVVIDPNINHKYLVSVDEAMRVKLQLEALEDNEILASINASVLDVIGKLSRDDKASWYAIKFGTKQELLSGGTWKQGFDGSSAGLPSGDGGDLGNIQSKARKLEMLAKTSYASSFNSQMREIEIVNKILEVRNLDDFYYTG